MKININQKNALYPMPITLVGSNVAGKPNFCTVAWVGILASDIFSVALNKERYTAKGIDENKTFSINIPSEEMLVQTDHVGIISGNKVDKSSLFEVHYGTLKSAPMIIKAPINIECKLIDKQSKSDHHNIYIGQVESVLADEKVLNNGKIDMSLVKPILFDMFQSKYWSLGKQIGDAWKIGNEYSNKK